jgi:hypothetical protein
MDGLFINVIRNMILIICHKRIETLIEDKLQKNIDVLHNWEEEGILVEKLVGDAHN